MKKDPWLKNNMIYMKITKAIIPVAGFGTRFLPITKTVPKELLPVVNKPVLQYIVEEAVAAGIKKFVLVISPEKKIIKEYFQPYPKLERKLQQDGKLSELAKIRSISRGLEFYYATQKEPLGTGHALLCAERYVHKGENFAYFDGDAIIDSTIPAISQVMAVFQKYPAEAAIGGMKVAREKVVHYGNLDVEKVTEHEFRLKGIIEKPSLGEAPPYNLVITGQRYVFTPKIFSYLKVQKPGKGGEIWLADAASRLAQEGGFYACEMQGKYYDTGNILEYLKTNIDFALKDPKINKGLKEYLQAFAKIGY